MHFSGRDVREKRKCGENGWKMVGKLCCTHHAIAVGLFQFAHLGGHFYPKVNLVTVLGSRKNAINGRKIGENGRKSRSAKLTFPTTLSLMYSEFASPGPESGFCSCAREGYSG